LLTGIYIGRVEIRRRLLWCGYSARDGAIYRRMRGCGRSGGILASVTDGRSEVSREVEDQLAVHDHVVVGLLEVACEHLWSIVSMCV
jgi:hypothetical protein